jgi:hypothetical protein
MLGIQLCPSRSLFAVIVALTAIGAVAVVSADGAQARSGSRTANNGHPKVKAAPVVPTFSYGQLQAQTPGAAGCGTNIAGEPALQVSADDEVFLGSEDGLGGGSELWRGLGAVGGGASASGCGLEYRGQPNAVDGFGASGGDIDVAVAPARNALRAFNVYVASLNLASVSVATSQDHGETFTQTPVQGGLPIDDREWIAAYGPSTSLLTYHDIATNDIDVLRSDDGGRTYLQVSQAIPVTDYKAQSNELGNLVIDHRTTAGTAPGKFWAYQSFVAPSDAAGSAYNKAWVAVSNDGGSTWTDRPIPCSTSDTDLDHNFPNVSVAPDGTLWYAWSDDHAVFTATSSDHGASWTCTGPVSTNTAQAIFPWLVATSAGVDLVYYGAPTPTNQAWSVYFAQNLTGTPAGWGTPRSVVAVHAGDVCEEGINCTDGRQLLDDFAVDTDQAGWAHIAYSHDAPALGGSGTYTGYAVQTGGSPIGRPN